jgi:hypothetical protein
MHFGGRTEESNRKLELVQTDIRTQYLSNTYLERYDYRYPLGFW